LANSLTQKPSFKKEDRYVNQEKSDQKMRSRNKNDRSTSQKRTDRSDKNFTSTPSTRVHYSKSQWKALTHAQQQAVKKQNSKNPSQGRRSTDSSSRSRLTHNTQQQQIVPFVPHQPTYPRLMAQYHHMPTYDYHTYGNRSVNAFSMPPRPHANPVPPPPPSPHPHSANSADPIDADCGHVGQYFGSFGPPHPHA
jgi:hypothetical protein